MKSVDPDDGVTYRLMKSIDAEPQLSQRALSESLGISLGKVNYCLKALVAKGLIKVKNFQHSDNKTAYAYILTPKGVEEKALVTVRFLLRKMAEYEQLQHEIEELRREIER